MEIPESLRSASSCSARVANLQGDGELMHVDSWISVMMGQHIEPETYHHLARAMTTELKDFMTKYRAQVAQVVNALPRTRTS
jgi:hypothetical protein